MEHPGEDTQAWVWRDAAGRRAVVAFRGTEQAKIKDVLTDAWLAPAGHNPERAAAGPLWGLLPDFAEPMVHSGFRKAYDAVRGPLLALVDSVTGGGDGWVVYVTGHSLGGALATLLASDLASRPDPKPRLAVYTFGSPRVGNAAFARDFGAAVKDSWRIVNDGDVVPTVSGSQAVRQSWEGCPPPLLNRSRP